MSNPYLHYNHNHNPEPPMRTQAVDRIFDNPSNADCVARCRKAKTCGAKIIDNAVKYASSVLRKNLLSRRDEHEVLKGHLKKQKCRKAKKGPGGLHIVFLPFQSYECGWQYGEVLERYACNSNSRWGAYLILKPCGGAGRGKLSKCRAVPEELAWDVDDIRINADL